MHWHLAGVQAFNYFICFTSSKSQSMANLTWHEHIEGDIATSDANLGWSRVSVEAHVVRFGIVCLVALAKCRYQQYGVPTSSIIKNKTTKPQQNAAHLKPHTSSVSYETSSTERLDRAPAPTRTRHPRRERLDRAPSRMTGHLDHTSSRTRLVRPTEKLRLT
jgi:hypothetical protein